MHLALKNYLLVPNIFIFYYRGDPIWLGIYRDSGQLTWQGECNDAASGTSGYPWDGATPDSSKPCVMMDGGSHEWKPEVCKQEYKVICEKDTGIYDSADE